MGSANHELIAALPGVRRFARALCGNQSSADATITRALEALIADRDRLAKFKNPKIALYATFLKIWNAGPISRLPIRFATNGALASADLNLQTLPSAYRQSFLLTTMEGFTSAEAAEILGRNGDEFDALAEEARRRVMSQIATDVLIIEDQFLLAMDCGNLIKGMGHRLLGIAANHKDAISLANQKRPGLILADIKLADGSSGLDAVNEMLGAFSVPVIFITGYPDSVVEAAKPRDAYLMAKPINPAALEAMITQALFFDERASPRLH
jgi:ActR/RegA family two-component response regulator